MQRYSGGSDECGEYYSSELKVNLLKYTVVRATPKGVWLCSGDNVRIREGKLFTTYASPRFTLKESRKRFACSTLEEAKESFYARKEKQASIYEGKAATARRAMDIVKTGNPWGFRA